MNNTNNLSARASYAVAREMFYKNFRDKFATDHECWAFVNSLKLSQSEIRLEVGLTATSSQFNFAMTANQTNTGNVTFNTENRLRLQDSLCVSEYGIFVAKPSSATATNYNLLTYANPNIFTTANVAAALDGTFYNNGYLSVNCNNDVLIPYRGLINHRYVPQTQQSGVTASATVPLYADQIRGAEDGFITQEPNLILVGTKNYQVSINLPGNLAAVETTQRAILIFRGVLAQNSTVVS